MPAINQPKLGELYNTTFFTPSSLISSVIVPASNVAQTDGQGGVYYVAALTMPTLISTIEGLGTAGYVSSTQLLSTVQNLGQLYISSPQLLSTVANLGSGGYVSSTQLLSTVTGLGSAGYLSSLTVQGFFQSTTLGLGSAGYVSSTQLTSTMNYIQNNFVSTASLLSTLDGLGSAGYVSSSQLASTALYFLQNYVSSGQALSTTVNLGSLNYISSSQLASTVAGLGSLQYISSTQLVSSIDYILQNYVSSGQLLSTVNNLGSINYISSTQLTSTVAGLGSANYVSSTQLISATTFLLNNFISTGQLASTTTGLTSTTNYILQNYVSSGQALSTTNNLGSLGYVSSQSLVSTVANLITNPVIQNLTILGSLSTSSTFTDFISTGQLNANTISANTVVVWGSNTLIVQGASLLSTTTVTGNLNVSTVSGSNGFVNSTGVSTSQVQVSSILMRDTASPGITYNFYANGGAPFFDNQQLIYNGYLASQLVSTVNNLGSVNYVSSTQLVSTVNNLGSLNYISSTQLISSIAGLGGAGLFSTVAGLGSAGYISSQQLTSTFDGLTRGFTTSSLNVATAIYAQSTYTRFTSTTYLLGRDITSEVVLPVGAYSLAYSANTTNWNNPSVNGFLTRGNAVCAGSNLWVAVGDSSNQEGSIKWSVNGQTWTNALSGGFTNTNGEHIGYAVAYSPTLGLYVAGGEGVSPRLSVLYSTDGKNWAAPVNGISEPVYGLTWAPGFGVSGLFIMVGEGNGIASRSIAYSADGSNWSAANSGFSNNVGNITIGYNVAHGGGRLWAVGYGNANSNMMTSIDGSNWTRRAGAPGNYFNNDGGFGIAYSPVLTRWVAVGNSFTGNNNETILLSADATGTGAWNYATTGGFDGVGNSVLWDGTKFVAVGAGEFNGGTVQTSTDGANWSSSPATPFEYYGSYIGNGIAYSNSQYVAVGDGQTLAGGTIATLINPSSISTTTLTCSEIIADTVTITGLNTLTVNGNSYFDGPAQFSTSVTTSSLNVNGTANFLGSVNMFGSNAGLNSAFVSTLQVTTSSIRFTDTVNSVSTNNLYTASNTLFYNGTQVLVGGGSSGSDLTLNNLRVLGTISSSSTFTNYVESSTINARTVSTLNTQVSTLSMKDIQFANVIHKLYASSSQLYFNTICVTSSFVGNGCGTCVDSNSSYSNISVVGSISTSSTFANYISTGNMDVFSLTANTISTNNAQASSITFQDNTLGTLYNLYAQGGNLYFGNSTIGTVPNVVSSNLWVDTLRVNNAVSTNALFANSVSTAVTSVSTLNLIDQVSGSAASLYTNGGLLYFGANQVLPFGPNMMFSTIAVRNTISTSSTFMNYLSTSQIVGRQLTTSSITATDLIISKISTQEIQTSSLRLVDTASATRVGSLINTNTNLTFNNMALAMGGSQGFAPQFSTLRIAQNISTASTFANFVSSAQVNTSSITAQNVQTRLLSTANAAVSSLTFTDGSSRINVYGTTTNFFYNNQAVPVGGTNSQNAVLSSITVQNNLTGSSTFTNSVSSLIVNAFQVQNTSSVTFVDSITGNPNYLYTSNSVLYLNQSPGIGVVTVSSNLTLSNLTVLDTISTTSTFLTFISSAQIETSSLNTSVLSVFESTVTDSLTANGLSVTADASVGGTLNVAGTANVTGNLGVTTVNNRTYPILNWGSATTACCGAYAGFADVTFATPYTTTPTVTVSLNDVQNELAILNITYTDTLGFTVGSYRINTGTMISSITFNYTAMGT